MILRKEKKTIKKPWNAGDNVISYERKDRIKLEQSTK